MYKNQTLSVLSANHQVTFIIQRQVTVIIAKNIGLPISCSLRMRLVFELEAHLLQL